MALLRSQIYQLPLHFDLSRPAKIVNNKGIHSSPGHAMLNGMNVNLLGTGFRKAILHLKLYHIQRTLSC